MSYNIFREATIVNSYVGSKSMANGYRAIFDTNRDDKGWDVGLNYNSFGAWRGFLFGTLVSTTGYIGRTSGFSVVDASTSEMVRIRMKIDVPSNMYGFDADVGKLQWVTAGDPVFNDTKSVTFTVIPDGEWHVYDIDLNSHEYWVGLVNNMRIFPVTNGAAGVEVFINYIEIGTTNIYFNTEELGDDTGSGRRGYSTSQTGGPFYTIMSGENDSLIVNIDGYGDLEIKISPGVNLSGLEVAKNIELQLAGIDLGGYAESSVVYDDNNRFIIYSGTRDYDSTVEIKWSSGTVATLLGFTDSSGVSTATTVVGEAPAGNYVPYANYKLRTLDIIRLFDGNVLQTASILNPESYVAEVGRADYAFVTKGAYVDFRGDTVIDIDHPVTAAGTLRTFRMQGLTDSGSKVKIFRPKLDGTLDLVYEKVIGAQEPGATYTMSFDNYKEVIDVAVRRGDLIGVYNCRLFIGTVDDTSKIPDATYYHISGDASGNFDPGSFTGKGTLGVSLYAHSSERQDIAVLDVDLGKRYNIDTITTTGKNNSTKIYYNILAGSNVSIDTDTYDYQHSHVTESVGTGAVTTIYHNNIAYNVSALTDGKLWAENGKSSFQTNDTNATYFYISGDAEYVFNSTSNSEFNPASVYFWGTGGEYKSQPYSIIFDFTGVGVEKPISRAVIYFKEPGSSFTFWWEQYEGANYRGGDGVIVADEGGLSDPLEASRWNLLPNYNQVFIDDQISSIPVLYENPSYGGLQFVGSRAYDYSKFVTLSSAKFVKIDWRFDETPTSKLKYTCNNHQSTKITEVELYASTDISSTPYGSVIFYFSGDGDTFALTSDTFLGDKIVNSYVGYNPRYLRIVILPFLSLTLNDITALLQTGYFRFGEDGQDESLLPTNTPQGAVGSTETLQVKNNSDQQLNLLASIGKESGSSGIVYYNKMSSVADILSPTIGSPPVDYYFDADKDFVVSTSENINIENQCWGLNSLMPGKTWYKSDWYSPESIKPTTFWWDLGGTISGTGFIGLLDDPTYGRAFKFVAVDLGQRYKLDSGFLPEVWGDELHTPWPTNQMVYSNTDTTDVGSVVWDNTTYTDVRWLRIGVSTLGTRYLDYIRAYPDITSHSHIGNKNTVWTSLGTGLSDNLTTTFVDSTKHPIVCSKLSSRRLISNHGLIGTSSSTTYLWDNSDFNFTYYSSEASSPDKFSWDVFGTDPATDNWVAVKNTNHGKLLSSIEIFLEDSVSLFSFPNLFSVQSYYLSNVSDLAVDHRDDEGLLYGASSSTETFEPFMAFNNDDSTYWQANGAATSSVWRLFGNRTGAEAGVVLTREKKKVKEFSITLNVSDSSSIIDDFKLQALTEDADPTDEGSWVDISGASYTAQAVQFGFSDVCDFFGSDCDDTDTETTQNAFLDLLWTDTNSYFDDGDYYTTVRYVLNEEVNTQGIKLVVTSTFDNTKDDSDNTAKFFVNITALDLYEATLTTAGGSVTFEEDFLNTNSLNVSSLKVTLPDSSNDIFTIVSDDIGVGTDSIVSERDFFSFDLYIDDVSKLDLSYGFVCFGNEYEKKYGWNISDQLSSVVNGWNTIKIRFLDAIDKSIPSLSEINYEIVELYPRVDVASTSCEYFSLALKGSGLASGAVFNLDNIRVARNDFDDVMPFNNGLYLSNQEYLVLPVADVSLAKGSVSFFLNPDYEGYGQNYPNSAVSRSYFTMTDVDNRAISFLLIAGQGPKLYVYDGLTYYHHSPGVVDMEKNVITHWAVSWDSTGISIDSRGTTVVIFKDGRVVYRSTTGWSATTNRGLTFFIGGTSPLRALYSEFIIPAGSSASYYERLSSVGGVMSNFTIYNYPKIDYNDYLTEYTDIDRGLVTPAEMIEISKDNVNFYGVGNGNLPLRVDNVAAGSSVPVYVRMNIPKGLTGSESRTAGLVVQWEIPL